MAIALPGSRGLFSHMQYVLIDRQSPHRITLTAKTHDAIADFKMLARGVVECPTQIAELIPLRPELLEPWLSFAPTLTLTKSNLLAVVTATKCSGIFMSKLHQS